jgi:hypothetical protein
MTKDVEAEADAIVARLAAKTTAKPCIVARHPQAALIDALLRRQVSALFIEREIGAGAPSDHSIRAHREGECSCRRTT